MRGSAGSFGITTSIKVKTFPAPPSATVFQYNWDLSATDASNGIDAFHSFIQTNIPPEFGAEINFGKGSVSGKVSFTLAGGWYGAANKFNAVISPLLAKLPKNPRKSLNVGTYINSVKVLAGSQSLNTSTAPDVHDTFYVKSIMTPASSPMSSASIRAFTNYLAQEGFSSTTVCAISLNMGWLSDVIYLLAMVLSSGTVWRHELCDQCCRDGCHRLRAQELNVYHAVLCVIPKYAATLSPIWPNIRRW